jgi:hypothetical protein
MIIEVAYGATVVLKVTPRAQADFSFLTGFNGPKAFKLPKGDTGLTLASCPRGTRPGPNGHVTDFYLGYRIRVGSTGTVDVWQSVSARPTEVTSTGSLNSAPRLRRALIAACDRVVTGILQRPGSPNMNVSRFSRF